MNLIEQRKKQTVMRMCVSASVALGLLTAVLVLSAGYGLKPAFAQAAAGTTDQAPEGWHLVGNDAANYKTGVDKGMMHDSLPSAYLAARVQDTGGFGMMMKSISAAKYAGKRVRLRGWARSKDVADWAGLWMRVRKGKDMVGFDNMVDRPIKGTSGWASYDVVLDVPKDATDISFGVGLAGPGEVWINDVKFDVVGPEVATTGSGAGVRHDAPVNLGFSFAEAGVTDRTPQGWELAGNSENYRTGVDRGMMHDSLRSAYLAARMQDTGGFGTLGQEVSPAKYAGKRVRLRAWVRPKDVTDWTGLWMRVDKGKEIVRFDNMRERPIKGTSGWASYDVVVDVPKDATDISFGVRLAGPGEVWINDVKFDVVGPEVATTGTGEGARPDAPVNLGFQSAGATDQAPEGWFLTGSKVPNYRKGVDKGMMHESLPSAYLAARVQDTGGFGSLGQTISPAKYADKRVRLRAWVRSKDVTDWAGLWMRVGRGKDMVGFDNMQERPIKGTSGWASYDVVLDVPKDATDIAFGVLLAGPGELWINNVKFDVVGPEIATTGIGARTGAGARHDAPVNLGFQK